MGGEISNLRKSVRKRSLDYRSLDTLINDIYFEEDFSKMDEENRKKITELVLAGKREEVRTLLAKYRAKIWGSMSYCYLRDLAKSRGIKNYSRLNRLDLCRELQRCENKK